MRRFLITPFSPLSDESDFHDDRQDHRAALRAVVEQPRETVAHADLDRAPLAHVLLHALADRAADEPARLLHQPLGLAHINEAARDDVRPGDDLARGRIDRADRDNQAVLREVLSVAQHDAAHIADAEAVDHDGSRRNVRQTADKRLVDLDGVADIADEDVFRRHAHAHRNARVLAQVLLLAVHRDEILRLRQRLNDLELLLTGVARNVHLVHRFVHDVAAALQKLVNNRADGFFVARDRARGDDNHVVLADGHLTVIVERHARQRGHRLALTARRDQDDLVLRVAGNHVEVDQEAVRHIQIAEAARDRHHIDHAAAGKRDLAAILRRAVDDLLHAADIRRERRDNQTLVVRIGTREHRLKGRVDLLLRLCVAGTLGVRRVGHQHEDALLAELRKPREIDHAALRRGKIDLEVAGVDDDACRRVEREAHRVGNRVVHVDQLHVEAAEMNVRARRRHMQPDMAEIVLLELVLDQRDRQRRAVDRHADLFEEVRQRADVVLVAVRDHNAADAVHVLFDEAEIRDDGVDAGHLLIRECEAAVDDDHILAALKEREVLADLVEAAEEIHLDGRLLLCAAAPALRLCRRLLRCERRSCGLLFPRCAALRGARRALRARLLLRRLLRRGLRRLLPLLRLFFLLCGLRLFRSLPARALRGLLNRVGDLSDECRVACRRAERLVLLLLGRIAERCGLNQSVHFLV